MASGEPAKMLEARLLVASRQVHTESGAHATEILTWETFARQVNAPLSRMSAAQAKTEIAQKVQAANDAFGAKGKLPWGNRAAQVRPKARAD